MSDETSQSNSKLPSHIVWQVIDSNKPDAKSIFRRVGAAWKSKSGNGLNVVLESVPLTGRLTILERNDKEDIEGQSSGPSPAP